MPAASDPGSAGSTITCVMPVTHALPRIAGTIAARPATVVSETMRPSKVDPIADAETVETELMLADLESLEKRVPAFQKKAAQGDKSTTIESDRLPPGGFVRCGEVAADHTSLEVGVDRVQRQAALR